MPLVDELPFVTYTARLADSRPEYVSPQIERLLELTAERAFAVGDFWTPRLHPLDRERVLRHWRAWCADPAAKPFRRTYRLLTESGRVVWVDDVTILLRSTRRRRTFRRHLLDVTEQHDLEDQLREAQKHEALGRVAGAVAHDFNNLLTVIAGYAQRLRSRLPEPAEADDAVAIAAAAERGTALVRQLLSYARPRPSDLRVIDLNALVADFAPMVRQVIGEDIELVLGFERNPLPVELDPARFDQVLMNLVVNARDAMPDGGRLTVSTAAVDVGDSSEDGRARELAAVVSVSDTGVGIDPGAAERIFEPFFTTKEQSKGSGLGLATVRGIVEEAGGSLDLSSAPGRGTTFWIYLPLASAELELPAAANVEPAAPPGGQEAVLLVEDEAALRELEQLTLEEAGYEVYAAADAAEALELAGKHGLDMMVVDVVLPGMNGPQLVEELASRGFDFPAVFVSGYGSDEVASRGLHAGTVTVVQKPFQPETLLRAVRAELDRASATVAALPVTHDADRDDDVLQVVRCLGCGAGYRRTRPPFSLSRSCCPRCGYVGWADVE
jgi:signal transduction histidine kinase/FixJ family two-component response regulator